MHIPHEKLHVFFFVQLIYIFFIFLNQIELRKKCCAFFLHSLYIKVFFVLLWNNKKKQAILNLLYFKGERERKKYKLTIIHIAKLYSLFCCCCCCCCSCFLLRSIEFEAKYYLNNNKNNRMQEEEEKKLQQACQWVRSRSKYLEQQKNNNVQRACSHDVFARVLLYFTNKVGINVVFFFSTENSQRSRYFVVVFCFCKVNMDMRFVAALFFFTNV